MLETRCQYSSNLNRFGLYLPKHTVAGNTISIFSGFQHFSFLLGGVTNNRNRLLICVLASNWNIALAHFCFFCYHLFFICSSCARHTMCDDEAGVTLDYSCICFFHSVQIYLIGKHAMKSPGTNFNSKLFHSKQFSCM